MSAEFAHVQALLPYPGLTWPGSNITSLLATSMFHNYIGRNLGTNPAPLQPTPVLNQSLAPRRLEFGASPAHPGMKPTTPPTTKLTTSLLTTGTPAPPLPQNEGKTVHCDPSAWAPPSPSQLYYNLPQRITLTYKAVATFATTLFVMLRRGWFHEGAWKGADEAALHISAMHPDYHALIRNVPALLSVPFKDLLRPRLDYAIQESIDKHRVRMLAACAVHYNLDFGLVTRFLGGEYTGQWRDTKRILELVRGLISDEDLGHIRRILTIGCPASFNWEESADNKEIFVRRAATSPILRHMKIVAKALNKEERNSHLIPFPRYLVRASSVAHHVPQAIIIKPGKKDRLVWDGSTKKYAHEITMNEVTPIVDEAAITFGYIYMAFLIWIWNLRITYPSDDIILAFIDISSCFRWPRIFPCLVGAFGFIIGPIFYAANAMVFGSKASATSWEPFRRAIAALAESYGGSDLLVDRHEAMLNMINITSPVVELDSPPIQAARCNINQGILLPGGARRHTPHFIYVDDNLMADTTNNMKYTLAAAIESIYTILGFPSLDIRPSAIAIDKWTTLSLGTSQVLLGLKFDSRAMTVGITPKFRADTLSLLKSSWHQARQSFSIHEMEVTVGKLGRIGQSFRPLYHLMPHLYASVAYALRQNKSYLSNTSKEFRELVRRAKISPSTDDDKRDVSFALQKSAQLLHKVDERYRIPVSLREELDYITALLADKSIQLTTQIAHIVPREYSFEAAADSCKFAGGGWSTDLKFWWHLPYPQEVIDKAHLPNNKSGSYISINVLEMACVILNLAASIVACCEDNIDLTSFPVLLNWCDNTSACSWINYKCKHSLIGRRLARLFIGLLMGTPIGIQAEWLSTHVNTVADDISRIRQQEGGSIDYANLFLTHPFLSHCRNFKPSDTLLGMIWEILLHKRSPDPLIIRRIEPRALGHFTSSSSSTDIR